MVRKLMRIGNSVGVTLDRKMLRSISLDAQPGLQSKLIKIKKELSSESAERMSGKPGSLDPVILRSCLVLTMFSRRQVHTVNNFSRLYG